MSPLNIRDESPIPKALVANRDIGGGLNLKSSIFTVPQNQMVKLQNYYMVEDGSLIGRRGTVATNAANSLGANAISGSAFAYLGTTSLLAQYQGSIERATSVASGSTFTAVAAGVFQTTALTAFLQYSGIMYATSSSSSDTPQKSSDGITWTAMGLAAPVGTPTVAVGAAGTPNGTYTVEITFSTATIESNPSPASGSVTVVSQNINVSTIPTGPAGTTKRTVYAFKNAVSSTYQKVADINDNTTTTYTITTDQPSWGVAAPSVNNPPVNGNWIMVLFKNRFWSAGDPNHTARLSFSNIFVPEAWPTTFFLDLPFDKGDQVTALFVLGDLLLVFGNNQLFYLIGDTPFSFILKQSFAQSGCPGPWAVDRVENSALFISGFGVYAFDGSQARLISDPIEPQFTGLFVNVASAMVYANAQKSTLKYFDRLKALVISIPTGAVAGANDATYWYFLRRTAWSQDTRFSRMFLVDDGITAITGGNRGDIYAWDNATGIVRKWDTGYQDDGINITALFTTGVLTGDNPETTKDWQWLTLRAQPLGVGASVTITGDQGVSSDTFSLNLARGAVIGTAIIGTDKIGASIDDFEERIFGIRARGIQVSISITYNVFFRVSELFLSYMAMGAVRRRVGPNA